MIAVIAIGFALLIVIAVVVGVLDAARADAWRRVAAERRRVWELRQQLQHHHVADHDTWDDD
ncbi:hypothetical protein ACVGVM_01260 [Pseudonocardia bannensis]|uniref:Uncharacterized protein n=1 Tax=Pseudonocardia bannensis TaxID=630973 RepID=A0A848DDE5_9PSEU|nr:hypothetical protein [Pseudonocardia bannensis]NMH90621.1 hypothetical protein [Pseudonocardia bannensis]